MALLGQELREEVSTVKPESRVEPLPQAAPGRSPDSMRGLESMALTQRPSESILAAGVTIEGKIEGNGHLRVAGRFKGNINVKGQFTIEAGASIDGKVKADTVLVVGEI